MKKLLLIDGYSMIFKAYYGTAFHSNTMHSPLGVPTNALYTTANMINNLVKTRQPDYVVVALDTGKKTFRHNQLKTYKANRSQAPEDLKKQFPLVKKFLNYYGLPMCAVTNFEADDVIATLASKALKQKIKVEIFSSDRDLLQLVNENTTVYLTTRGFSQLDEINSTNFLQKQAIKPSQITDLKALMGDKSDNLLGIPGIGSKTAHKLITKYGSLQGIYDNLEKISPRWAKKLVNHHDQAWNCKAIATLVSDIAIDLSWDDMSYHPSNLNQTKMRSFLHEYGMYSLFKKLNLKLVNQENINFLQLKDLPDDFTSKVCGVSFEAKHANYHISDVWGIAICDGKTSVFIAKDSFATVLNLKQFLKSSLYQKVVFGNSQTINLAHYFGLEINNVIFDIQLAAHLINHQINSNIYDVDQSFTKSFTIEKDEDVYGKGVKKNPPSLSKIAKQLVAKTKWIYHFYQKFRKLLETKQLSKLYYEIEFPLSFVLAKMEQHGVLIDQVKIKDLEKQISCKMTSLEKIIYQDAKQEFNILSPQELGIILFEKLKLPSYKKTKTNKYATSSEVLIELVDKHPIVQHIINYRRYAKLLSTSILGLQEFILEDQRIHTIYNQTLTSTGRISSSFPNLQNIAIKNDEQKVIRQIFVASSGKILLAFDYSQIELRILAHMAQSQELIKAFKNNEDIHSLTASKVFNCALEKVTPQLRRQAKAINFGIIYGISAYGLSQQLKISLEQAKKIIQAYKTSYPQIENYRQKCISLGEKTGYVKTILQRKRFVPELASSHYQTKEFGKRIAVNAPIQGSASDILKKAMINITKKIKQQNLNDKITMIMQVHDELIFEVDQSQITLAKELISQEMSSVVKLDVDLEVKCQEGSNLFDLK